MNEAMWLWVQVAIVAGLLVGVHWTAAANGWLVSIVFWIFDVPAIVAIIHGGNYYALLERGTGYWSPNRALNYVIFVGACVLPPIVREVADRINWHWRGGRERFYQDAHSRRWITDEQLAQRLLR